MNQKDAYVIKVLNELVDSMNNQTDTTQAVEKLLESTDKLIKKVEKVANPNIDQVKAISDLANNVQFIKGDKGETGDKGSPFTFEDLTIEQKKELVKHFEPLVRHGKTPIKGKDYFTVEEVKSIQDQIYNQLASRDFVLTDKDRLEVTKQVADSIILPTMFELARGLEALPEADKLDPEKALKDFKKAVQKVQLKPTGRGGGRSANINEVTNPSSSTDNAIARFDGTTGKVIQNSGVTIDDNDNVGTVNSINFNLTPTITPAEGDLYWDAADKTLAVRLDSQSTLQLGQEIHLRATNKTGAGITNGQVVYINGAQGQRPTIALADASTETTSDGTIGVVTQDIANNNTGYVTTEGLVRGLDTSSFSEGAVIYLSETAGAFTTTIPTQPAHIVKLGVVVYSHATEGIIYVSINTGQHLDALHDVLITSPSNNQILQYEAVTELWKNKTLTAGETTLLPYVDQSSGTDDTHGQLVGTINGSNTVFTVSQGSYRTGTLLVKVNGVGQMQGSDKSFVETSPATGTFTFNTAPATGSDIQVEYMVGTPAELVENVVVTKTNDYTITGSEATAEITILVDATSNDVDITLPSASILANRMVNIKRIDGSANVVTIVGTIDADVSPTIANQYTSVRITSDSSNFYYI